MEQHWTWSSTGISKSWGKALGQPKAVTRQVQNQAASEERTKRKIGDKAFACDMFQAANKVEAIGAMDGEPCCRKGGQDAAHVGSKATWCHTSFLAPMSLEMPRHVTINLSMLPA